MKNFAPGCCHVFDLERERERVSLDRHPEPVILKKVAQRRPVRGNGSVFQSLVCLLKFVFDRNAITKKGCLALRDQLTVDILLGAE